MFILDPDGGQPSPITSSPSDEHYANWSSDGEWLYFGSNRSGRWETWKIPAAGGEPEQVTKSGGTLAKESPDGQSIYFVKEGDIKAGIPLFRLSNSGEGESIFIESIVGHHFVPTADGMYFVPTPPPGHGFSLQFLSFASGETKKIADIEHPLHSTLDLSPDGRYLIFSQYDHIEADIVMLEGF